MNDRRQRRSSSDHAIEPQRLRNRPFLVRRALRLLRIVGFRLVVALAREDPVFPLHLRDVQCRDRQTAVLPDIRFDVVISLRRLAFGGRHIQLVHIDVDGELSGVRKFRQKHNSCDIMRHCVTTFRVDSRQAGYHREPRHLFSEQRNRYAALPSETD